MNKRIDGETIGLIILGAVCLGILLFAVTQTINNYQQAQLIKNLAAQSNEYNALKLAWELRQR